MSLKCPICGSSKMISLYEKYFCEVCDAYFTNLLEPSALPIPDNIRQPALCNGCSKMLNRTIYCRNFKEYIRRHVFCSACKQASLEYLQYNFYKYFSLYRINERMLSRWQLSLLVTLFILSNWLLEMRYVLLLLSEMLHGIKYTSVLKLLCMPFIGKWLLWPVGLAILFRGFTARTHIYRMPAMFTDFDIQEYISRLRIGDSGSKLRLDVCASTPPKPVSTAKKPVLDKNLEKKIRNLKIG